MEELIQRITEEVFSVQPDTIEPVLGKGKNNHVFKLKVSDGIHILRMNDQPEYMAVYEKEQRCASAARSGGILTPHITAVGTCEGWSYSWQEYIDGVRGTEAEQLIVWRKLGECARVIHRVSAEYCAISYERTINDLFADNYFSSRHVFAPALTAAIETRLRESTAWTFSPQLCHGNLHPSNVILSGVGELWLLDWETATGNMAPLADLAEIYTWNNGKENIEAFFDGYGLSSAEVRAMQRDIQTLVLLRLVSVMRQKIDQTPNQEWKHDPFVTGTKERIANLPDLQADIFFTKNL